MIWGRMGLAILVSAWGIQSRTLEVGPGKAYAKPSLAAAAAKDGDTVLFAATVFSGDAATWSADSLTLRGTAAYAPFAHMRADGAQAQGKGTWVITGDGYTVENIEFSGAKVADGNGAGIRQEGAGLTLRNCRFHDNENGILTGAGKGGILIEYCEFASNGAGDGYTHNMYIGEVESFTLRHCYSHLAKVGHNVKSRAARNLILYNRIMDEADGTSSYDIDLPNGGVAVILGNVVQQGPKTENPTVIAYGAEGLKHAVNEFYAVHNTVVNDRQGGTFFSLAGKPTVAKLLNNLMVGLGTPYSGTMMDTGGNVATQSPAFLDRAKYDYRLTGSSPGIDKTVDPESGGGQSLSPVFQYADPVSRTARMATGKADAGAFELGAGAALRPWSSRRGGLAAKLRVGWGDGAGWFVHPADGSRPFDLLGARLPTPD